MFYVIFVMGLISKIISILRLNMVPFIIIRRTIYNVICCDINFVSWKNSSNRIQNTHVGVDLQRKEYCPGKGFVKVKAFISLLRGVRILCLKLLVSAFFHRLSFIITINLIISTYKTTCTLHAVIHFRCVRVLLFYILYAEWTARHTLTTVR